MNGEATRTIQPVAAHPADCLVEARHITKSFSGIRVLEDVSLEVRTGEVHALTGENGAGKSTLMKILAGSCAPDAGEVLMRGRKLALGSPPEALRAGVAMIYQELLPFPDLTVAENIFMGQEPASRVWGWVDKRAMRRNAAGLLSRLGVELPLARRMRDLRVAELQTVEIARALAHRAALIIMDEPTSALSAREAEALFRIIHELRQQGTAILYISHKLEEVFRLADRVTVLQDGAWMATRRLDEVTPDQLITLMVGRQLPARQVVAPPSPGAPMLAVRALEKIGRFRPVSFQVAAGEVLGLAGLMGAGRTDLVNAVYGLEPADAGEILIAGQPVRIRRPADALAAGIGLVSEDRKTYGLVPTLGVQHNLTLAALSRWSRAGVIRRGAESRAAQEQIRAFGIKVSHANQTVEHLSGGNQQKVVLGRTLLHEPKILLLDEPTRGIDIAAKAQVHDWIARSAAAGKAVVLVSSELPELFALCHRILVMREGEVTAELETRRTTPEEVLKLAVP